MTTTTKILLTISIAAFAISTTGVLWGIALPIGAITFGLFMIFKLLEKEAGLYDAEQHASAQKARATYAPARGASAGQVALESSSTRPASATRSPASAVFH
jgi:hypothetical protein